MEGNLIGNHLRMIKNQKKELFWNMRYQYVNKPALASHVWAENRELEHAVELTRRKFSSSLSYGTHYLFQE